MPVAAGVVADARKIAVIALVDVAAQSRRPAGLDRLHQFEMMQRQPMGLAVGGSVAAKDVGQFEIRPEHRRLGLRFGLLLRCRSGIEPVEGTYSGGHQLRRDPCIARGGVDVAMTEQNLNHAHVRAVLQ